MAGRGAWLPWRPAGCSTGGIHRYAFTLGNRRQRAQVRVAMDPVPYPKIPDHHQEALR